MRTKTLFLAAAALAAGLASSMAQSNVYSVNIVGYYGVTIPANQNIIVANQLDNTSATTSNDLNSVLTALPSKSSAQLWTGSSFQVCSKGGSGWTPNGIIAPGSAMWVKTPSTAGTLTNTFVGSAPVSNNTALPSSVNVLVGGRIPFSGTGNDAGANTLNLASLPSKSTMQVWTGSSFQVCSKGGSGWTPNPTISVGQGYWLNSKGASTWTEWIQ